MAGPCKTPTRQVKRAEKRKAEKTPISALAPGDPWSTLSGRGRIGVRRTTRANRKRLPRSIRRFHGRLID